MTAIEALVPGHTVLDQTVAARAPWSAVVSAGDVLTIVDLAGNQAVDCLLYSAADTAVRYSAAETVARQGRVALTTGSVLRADTGAALMTVIADEVGVHDTLGGACSKESNTLRYGQHTRAQHGCMENFLIEGARWGLGARDLAGNINWFMNVPVDPDGALGIVDGLSGRVSASHCAPTSTRSYSCRTARRSTTPATPSTPHPSG